MSTYIFWLNLRVWRIPHGSSFGIIVRTLGIEVHKVFGCILTDSEIADGYSRFGVHFLADCISRLGVFVFIVVLFVAGTKVGILFLPNFRHFAGRSKVGGCLVIDLFLAKSLPFFFNSSIFFVDTAVLGRIVAIPPIAFCVVVSRDFLDDLVRLDIFAGILCAPLSWPLQAVVCLVCHGTAILACTFTKFGGCRSCALPPVIPLVKFIRRAVVGQAPLMVQ